MAFKLKMADLDSLLMLHFNSKSKDSDQKRPLMLRGPAGVGKTTAVKAFAKKIGVKCYEYRAAYSEPGDLKGLCDRNGDDMIFLRPEDFPKINEEDSILFFDEVNRASTSVMNCILQATDGSGRIASHKLPKGCLVVAAINPDDNSYSVNAMDFAMRNRFNIVDIEYDHNSLLTYSKKNSWHHNVVMFLEVDKNIISPDAKDDGQNNAPTPRSLEYMSDLEHVGFPNDTIHLATSIGLFGPRIGTEYHAFTKGEKPITLEELFEGKDVIKRIKKLSEPGVLRQDILGVTSNLIIDYLKNKTPQNVDKKHYRKIVEFLEMIPADLAAGTLTNILQENQSFIDTFQAEEALMYRLGNKLKK